MAFQDAGGRPPQAALPPPQSLSVLPVKDFQPIVMLVKVPTILTVPASSPANSLKDLLDLARQKPGGDFSIEAITNPSQNLSNTPVEVLEAVYAGQLADVGVFLVSAVPGGDPIGSLVRVVDASSCEELTTFTA